VTADVRRNKISNEPTGAAQLSSLARVAHILESAAVEYWLFGGWAVDFYAGSSTRVHDDVDIAVWHEDFDRIAQLLTADGWVHSPDEGEDGGTGFERGAVRLELTYLERRDDGRVVTPLRAGSAGWPDDTFGGDVCELHGVRARVVALSSLREMKSLPRDAADEAAKDRADFARLSQLS
jgi:Aminoglycoside-2''-adenylyltransferase